MGRPKGKSPVRGGGQVKGQRRLDEYTKPRRSARLRNGDQKLDKVKIEETADLLLETRNTQTILLEEKTIENAKAKKGKAAKTDNGKKMEVGARQKSTLSAEEQKELLKNFDISNVYGPCRGISRRERYLRALRFNLQPPPDELIVQILNEHESDFTFQKCIWDQNELLKLHV